MRRFALIFALVSCIAGSAFAHKKEAPASAPTKEEASKRVIIIDFGEDELIEEGPNICTIGAEPTKPRLIRLREDFNHEMIRSIDEL